MSEVLKELVAKDMDRSSAEFCELSEEIASAKIINVSFCRNLIERLSEGIGSEFNNVKYFQWNKQPEDIFVSWGETNPVSMQVDPLCEVICSYGHEFGPWNEKKDAILMFLEQYREGLKGV